MSQFHPESPDVAAGDLAQLRFVAELRNQLFNRLNHGHRAIYETRLKAPEDEALSGADAAERREDLRQRMEGEPYYQAWSSLLRSSQDLMWRLVDQSVSADLPALEARLANGVEAPGSLELDPGLEVPTYLRRADTHRMPGSYFSQTRPHDMRAGALYDLGSALYQFGRGDQGGRLLNNSRGRTTVAHLTQNYPDLAPVRISISAARSARTPCRFATPSQARAWTPLTSARPCFAMPACAPRAWVAPCISASATPKPPGSPIRASTWSSPRSCCTKPRPKRRATS